MRKNCSSDREKLLKFKAEGREFAKFLRSLEQFIQTVKEQFLVSECFFNLILEVSQKNCNSNWKKILGVRNMQEKLEKYHVSMQTNPGF